MTHRTSWLESTGECIGRHLTFGLQYRSDSAEAGLLRQLFAKYATPAVAYVLEGIDAGELVQKLKLTIPVTNLNLITQLCHLLETLLLDSGHYTDPNVSSASQAWHAVTAGLFCAALPHAAS